MEAKKEVMDREALVQRSAGRLFGRAREYYNWC